MSVQVVTFLAQQTGTIALVLARSQARSPEVVQPAAVTLRGTGPIPAKVCAADAVPCSWCALTLMGCATWQSWHLTGGDVAQVVERVRGAESVARIRAGSRRSMSRKSTKRKDLLTVGTSYHITVHRCVTTQSV